MMASRRGSSRRSAVSATGSATASEPRARPPSASLGRGRQRADSAPVRRVIDQRFEAPSPGLFALRADDPVGGRRSISGRLRLEEFPRLRVGTELTLERTSELRLPPLLVGIDRRSVVPSGLERLAAGWVHAPLGDQLFRPLDVPRAPRASTRSGSEPVRVAHVIDAAPDAVDPPEREGLVDGLGPGDARYARALLVEPDEELLGRRMVLLQPCAELRRCGEEPGSHRVIASHRSSRTGAAVPSRRCPRPLHPSDPSSGVGSTWSRSSCPSRPAWCWCSLPRAPLPERPPPSTR